MGKKSVFKRVGLPGDDTQFRVEMHTPGLWSNQNEVRIRREYKGKPSRYGHSFPESTLDDLIANLVEYRDELKRLKDQD
ncbi:hypothetical protein [Spirosoma sp. KUDC1026]|uniref:hypothetical protein n=1 Tax=Spirosoma sp. KUDC1026 TaxID=2745947 RepID=UPI00159B9224|nr:hypothetical protein [Spirosoma sp. KUDC1026]QKZ15898.1 hypothetical protein HU175_24580 [Spirosoma sp. KUDC1026]